MKVNRWLDLLDRVGWTAIQATAGAVLAAFSAGVDWEQGLIMVATATLAAVCKVVLAQRAGSDDLGAAVPGQVLEPK